MTVDHAPRRTRRDGGGTRRTRRSGLRRRTIVVLTVLVVLVLAYLGAAWFAGDRVPRGTTVAGVPVGGLTTADAEQRLAEGLAEAAARPLAVALADTEIELDPTEAGLAVDAPATAAELTGFSLDPRRLLAHLGGGTERDPVLDVDDAALTETLRGAIDVLEVAPVEGEIHFRDGAAEVTEAADGLTLNVLDSAAVVREHWLRTTEPIDLVGVPLPPAITGEAVEAAMRDVVTPLTSGPVVVAAEGEDVVLEVADLLAMSQMVPTGAELALDIDEEELRDFVLEHSPDVRAPATDAQIVLRDGEPTILPASSGQDVDAPALRRGVLAAATATSEEERRVSVDLVEVEPEFSTADAEALGVVEVVAAFDTPFFHDPPRTANLRRGAELITNTLIKPGETFSLIDVLGPITAENGYSRAGVVVSGLETQGMGGGLSQVSTTVFNVAFFAGVDLVEFQTHSHNYPRYPAGREATIYTPHIDMKWTNTTPYGALMQAWVADGRFHVQMWGTKHFDVSTHSSDRYNFTNPSTVRHSGPTCVANDNPSQGFTITVSRTVSLEDEVVEERSWTTTYVPWDRVICE
ncbi:MAG TPA: VanW family protein [Actinomycetaceae bacterium]|nr:VanW family protein [Actinomycetaceae bacterium]